MKITITMIVDDQSVLDANAECVKCTGGNMDLRDYIEAKVGLLGKKMKLSGLEVSAHFVGGLSNRI